MKRSVLDYNVHINNDNNNNNNNKCSVEVIKNNIINVMYILILVIVQHRSTHTTSFVVTDVERRGRS